MGQSTEDYLDRLLRQAMGEAEPEEEIQEEIQEISSPLIDEPVPDMTPTIEYPEPIQEVESIQPEGANFTSNKASQFFADDSPFSEDFVYPEEALQPEVGNSIPSDMQMTQEGQMVLDAGFGEEENNDDMLALLNSLGNSEEPVIEEPVIEEPVIEEPVIEEPVIEEPIIEDTVIEEEIDNPVIEEIKPMTLDDLDPANANKAMDPDDIAALFASMNAGPAAEEAAVEEPIIEEPVIEEPAIEEPKSISIDDLDPANANKAMDPDDIAALFASMNAGPAAEEAAVEEPIIEEPVIEETPIEEPKTLSIDDLDPADANKAMDPDDIAALFASMNAGPAAEKAAVEEPIIEEPLIEEPAIEEPKSISIDDLDPADANKAMDPDDIAALFASMNDTPSPDFVDELEPDFFEDDTPAGDLLEDKEISELLNSLDEMDKPSPAQMEVGGFDAGSVDLGAMLDDVNSSVSSPSFNDNFNSDDFSASDLNALLNSIDGDDDISDIGDMLMKDENSLTVDPDSQDVERLFASTDENEIFDINNVIEEVREEKKQKKSKKKKEKKAKDGGTDENKVGFIEKIKGLFSKKKLDKADGDNYVFPDDMEGEVMIDPELLDITDKSSKGSVDDGNKGFLKRLFDKLFEEVDEDPVSGKLLGETAVDVASEGAEVNEKLLKEGADKKKKEKKKKEKPKKEKPKKEKKPPKPKKEKKPKPEEPPTKKLPKKKVAAIFAFCVSVGALIAFVCFFVPYSKDMKLAQECYNAGDLKGTYEHLSGHELDEENQLLFNKTFTVLKLQRHYESYLNFMKLKRKFDALNALVQGVQAIDKFQSQADQLGVSDKFNRFADIITSELMNTFSVSVDQARQWIKLEGSPEYTQTLYDYLYNMEVRDESGEPISVPNVNDEVLQVEEENL